MQQQQQPIENSFAPRLEGAQIPERTYWSLMGELGLTGEWEGFLDAVKLRNAQHLDLSQLQLGDVGWWALSQALFDNAEGILSIDLR